MLSILRSLGAKVEVDIGSGQILVNTDSVRSVEPCLEEMKKTRGGFFVIGPLLTRFGEAVAGLPEQNHIIRFRFVVSVRFPWQFLCSKNRDGKMFAYAANVRGLVGGTFHLDFPSVGAIETLMMAACMANGVTTLSNVAKEPEVIDLAPFLNDCGACVYGVGTDKLLIKGKCHLHGSEYVVPPDRIEAGTFMLAAAITRSCISMSPIIPSHLVCLIDKLKIPGCRITQFNHDTLEVSAMPANVGDHMQGFDIKTDVNASIFCHLDSKRTAEAWSRHSGYVGALLWFLGERKEGAVTRRLYDMIILGASGFTGKYVVREALKVLDSPSSPIKTLALAGRNPTKLAQTLQWAANPTPTPTPPPPIPILTADTTDPMSLQQLCSKTNLILNCVGPFRLFAEPVVAACAHSGCNYLDICGEPEFMERMEAKYHEQAMETGCLVVSGCGFDSIPAELGLMFNSRQWVTPSAPNRVEAYVSLESDSRIVGNFATYESAVLGVANAQNLQELRRSRPKRARPPIPGPPPPKGPMIEFQEKIGLWAVKLPSADSTIIRRTLSILAENPHGLPGMNESPQHIEKRKAFWSTVKPAHFGEKIGSKSLLGIYKFITIGKLIVLLSGTAFGRWFLLKYPSIFSIGYFRKNGPSEEEVKSASFKMWFVGHGFSDSTRENVKPDMEIITRVTGPEIGYVATPIILLQCAIIVSSQRQNLPKGGVYTPGIIFGSTDLQKRLHNNGISFHVISKTTLLP
ncbi:hypothetical protein Q3G72_025005 [Acer saccharum]|nr:hypothetical protein Q3G72_025005 [Acer saccharum]